MAPKWSVVMPLVHNRTLTKLRDENSPLRKRMKSNPTKRWWWRPTPSKSRSGYSYHRSKTNELSTSLSISHVPDSYLCALIRLKQFILPILSSACLRLLVCAVLVQPSILPLQAPLCASTTLRPEFMEAYETRLKDLSVKKHGCTIEYPPVETHEDVCINVRHSKATPNLLIIPTMAK